MKNSKISNLLRFHLGEHIVFVADYYCLDRNLLDLVSERRNLNKVLWKGITYQKSPWVFLFFKKVFSWVLRRLACLSKKCFSVFVLSSYGDLRRRNKELILAFLSLLTSTSDYHIPSSDSINQQPRCKWCLRNSYHLGAHQSDLLITFLHRFPSH